jgi:hypothetical protein
MTNLVILLHKTENAHGQTKYVLSYSHMVCLNPYHYLDSTVNVATPLYQFPSSLLIIVSER